MEIRICADGKCTACNACISICPKKCIHFETEECSETKYAVRNSERCIDCGLCKKVCTQNNDYLFHVPKMCFAAWSLREKNRFYSASGGIATEIYHYYINKHGKIAGVLINESYEAIFKLGDNSSLIEKFQNSKYVESNTGNIFNEIAQALKQDDSIVFVGLPCQVAALNMFLSEKRVNTDSLLTIDLICHGTTPVTFLKQHILTIENKTKRQVSDVKFRDPAMGTKNYCFTLYNNNSCIYKKRVRENDVYQIGYHYGLSYRSNCYNCSFANTRRPGDLTLADFDSGLGKYAECSYSNENVSCVLVNTEKGRLLLDELRSNKILFLDRRPIEEEIKFEKQLNGPTPVTKEREEFIKLYSECKDFEYSMKRATRRIIRINMLKKYSRYDDIKRLIKRIVPYELIQILKRRK